MNKNANWIRAMAEAFYKRSDFSNRASQNAKILFSSVTFVNLSTFEHAEKNF